MGGTIGDLFGRKWTLIAGLVGLSIASAIGGLAESFGVLVAARTLQGAFGALLAPSVLGLLTVTATHHPDSGTAVRNTAVSIDSASGMQIAAGRSSRCNVLRRCTNATLPTTAGTHNEIAW